MTLCEMVKELKIKTINYQVYFSIMKMILKSIFCKKNNDLGNHPINSGESQNK